LWGRQHEPEGVIGYFSSILKSVRFFRSNRVDLLHINHANYWRPAEIVAAKILGIPIVTHYHVVVKKPAPFVKYSTCIAAVSRYTAEHSLPEGIPKAIIHNSVDVRRYDKAKNIRDELGLEENDVVVSFIGQIRDIKGVDLFIKMAHGIEGDNVKFLIVGECRDPKIYHGSYTKEMLDNEIDGDPRIRYTGYRSDVENIYASSDIIVMPSRWEEPFGLINIEAGAARKPMISTNVGGIAEIIKHGENGYLADGEDVASLTAYTRKLIEDKKLRLKMGERAREIVEEMFTTRPIRELERLYDKLI
jgi:glycosyltransferase involved in cell wall biosynthesis